MSIRFSPTYSERFRSKISLRNFCKIKLYLKVSSVTLVTYFKNCESADEKHFIGRTHIFDFRTWSRQLIQVEHNEHSPPEEKESEDEEEVTEPLPAYGSRLLPV